MDEKCRLWQMERIRWSILDRRCGVREAENDLVPLGIPQPDAHVLATIWIYERDVRIRNEVKWGTNYGGEK